MLTLKVPFVWITLANIVLFFLAFLKALFIWSLVTSAILRMFIPIIIVFFLSWHCYFKGFEINLHTHHSRQFFRRATVTEGDKMFIEALSKPTAYLLGLIDLGILIYLVFVR